MGETLNTNKIKKGNKKMAIKIIIGVIIIALVIGLYFTGNYIYQLQEYKKRIADISITNVDLSKIPDGSYTG